MSNDLKTPQDLIFDFIYVMAMRDATLQKAYKGEKVWLTESSFYNKWTEKLKAFVDMALTSGFENQSDYDKTFIQLAKGICDKINTVAKEEIGKDISKAKYRFTFGNAQKLINMTMKYYYILVYYNTDLREKFKFCHCPMDSQLLEKVWDDLKGDAKCRREKLGTVDEFKKGWGGMDFGEKKGEVCFPERYNIFQEIVRELAKGEKIELLSIEFDYKAWNNK